MSRKTCECPSRRNDSDRQAVELPDSALTGRCSSDHTGATYAAYPTLRREPPARFLTRILCVVEPSPLVTSKRPSNAWSTALWPEATALPVFWIACRNFTYEPRADAQL